LSEFLVFPILPVVNVGILGNNFSSSFVESTIH